jgi:glycosyltransferase involved in cell wall biosynthesis
VQALARDPHVHVTGHVPDVRPYLLRAAVAVAPIRYAVGIQNKVLEAMAMGRPVVTTAECARAVTPDPGGALADAADQGAFVAAVDALLRDPERARALGAAGQRLVRRDYSWDAHLAAFERHLERLRTAPPLAA